MATVPHLVWFSISHQISVPSVDETTLQCIHKAEYQVNSSQLKVDRPDHPFQSINEKEILGCRGVGCV